MTYLNKMAINHQMEKAVVVLSQQLLSELALNAAPASTPVNDPPRPRLDARTHLRHKIIRTSEIFQSENVIIVTATTVVIDVRSVKLVYKRLVEFL